MTTLVKPHLQVPVGSVDDLADYLARGARSPGNWGVGAEMEKLVIDADTGEAAHFDRIEALLLALEESGHWRGVREEGRLIALLGTKSSITLEPGGQLELSGELCPDVHCCDGDFSRHIAQIVGAGDPLGLAFLGLGVQPFTPLERIAWIPKSRYGIMGPYMTRTGDLGQAMMKQTAGLQVNLDFTDEEDCFQKLRLSIALAPLLYALFANSPLLEGKPSGFLSTRGEIWRRTDPDRTGLLPEIFRPEAGFGTYVQWALDVPMYFIVRDDRFLDLTRERFTFRRYMTEGFAGHRATVGDWDLHLSTLFPEARLRPQIEVRCVDSLPPRLAMAVPALLKGLLYDADAAKAAWALFQNQSETDREELYRASWKHGLKAPFGRRTLGEAAVEILAIAREGLRNQQRKNGRGLDETIYLDGIAEIAESGTTLAERLLSRWSTERSGNVALLLAHCGYR